MKNKLLAWVKALLIVLPIIIDDVCAVYVIDDSVGLGRMFDGIGGLSGGGVSQVTIEFFLPHSFDLEITSKRFLCTNYSFAFAV